MSSAGTSLKRTLQMPARLLAHPLASRFPVRDPLLLAVLALGCLYVATMSGHLHSIDGLLAYHQARSLTFDGSLRFDPPLTWDNVTYTTSKYGIGLSLLYVPGLVLWSWLVPYAPPLPGGQVNFEHYYADPLYTAIGPPVHIAIALATAYLVGRFCLDLGLGWAIALWGMVLYGIASPAIVYTRGDYSQPLSGLCWLAALYFAYRFRATGRRSSLAIAAAALFYALLSRPVEGTVLLPGLLVLLLPLERLPGTRRLDWRPGAVVLGAFAAGALAVLLVNWGRYGSPLTTGYEGEGWTNPLPVGLAGALFSSGRGILWQFPAVLLAPVGLLGLWRIPTRRALAIALMLTVVLQLLNVATWHFWWGGWNWGLRLFVPALPLFAVLAAMGIGALPGALRQWVPAVLLVAGAAWALPGVLTDLLGGYGGAYNSAEASFRLDAYPPIGAWPYLHHWRALTPADSSAADILWLRIARDTGNISLLVMLVLLLVAGVLGALSIQAAREE
jgi:hypothetical protein